MIHNRPGRWRRLALVASLCMLATACTGGQQPFRPSYPQSGLSIAAPISPRPNIVFILTDDLSMNLLPYMPHVQALALRGMTFKDYFVVDSFCCPSRASIFTGQYPHDTGVFTNGGADGGYAGYNHFGNPPKSFAIGLRRAGYRTGFMGKYFNGYDPRFKPAPGWDTWFGVGDGYRAFDYWVNDDGKRTHYGSRPQDFLNSVMTTKASNFIESARGAGKPFALELATFSPHKPYAAAPRDVGTFPTVTAPRGPAFGRAPANAPAWLQWMPRFTASDVQSLDLAFRQRVESVQSVDRMIEELERELIKTGELRNTYFVFSSDNGLHLGEHRMLAGKTTAFDTDIKVPLIVAGPGVPAGSTVSAMASSIDLAPTFLQIAGARPTDRPDGVSLLSLLHGARRPPNWQSAILVEHHGPAFTPSDPDQQPSRSGNPPSYEAVRTADFLYVEYATGDREYYDLRHDPQEMNNIESKLTAARLMSLHQMLTALEACHGASACQAAAAASA